MILGQQRRADHGFAAALRPRRQTVKRRAAPKTALATTLVSKTTFTVGGGLPREDEVFYAVSHPLHGAGDGASSAGVISGSSRPASSSDRTRAGVKARRFRSTISPLV